MKHLLTNAALDPVGDVACIERERKHRCELRETHNAEREGIARQFVDLPGDGRRHDLHGDGTGEAARLVAWIVPEAPAGLRVWLNERLPASLVPAAFEKLDALPLTVNGKIDRRALEQRPLSRPRISAEVEDALLSPVEAFLAAAWRELLGVARIGRSEDVFDLGATSVLAAELLGRLQEDLGIELPLREVYKAPTIASLAERIVELSDTPAAVAAPMLAEGEPGVSSVKRGSSWNVTCAPMAAEVSPRW